MKLYRFNPEGVNRFGQFLDALAADPSLAVPADILTDSSCVVQVPPGVEIDGRQFQNRMEAARHLDGILCQVTGCDVERDAGLWAWLALFYFDQLCPPDRQGLREPGKRSKWIPEVSESRRYYRHLLLGPYRIYRAHRDDPERARALLADPVTVSTSEVYRLLVENPSLVTCNAVVEAATLLYYDPVKGRIRRGAGAKGEGGARRFVQILQQFDCTFDLAMLHTNRLLELLPTEFNRFKQARLFA
jgi:hypothetical protein